MTYEFLRKYFEDTEFNSIKKEKELFKINYINILQLYNDLVNLKEDEKELPIKEEYWNNKNK